jgi:hypothetical protein
MVSDFKGVDGLWIKSYRAAGDRYRTKSGQVWSDIVKRCKIGGSHQLRYPTYLGCKVSETFKDFQLFTNWYVSQAGYSVRGYQLDKDILVSGNKLYSEHTCVLVPQQLNLFLTDSGRARGDWQQGVDFNKVTSKFRVQINIDGERKHLGYYATPEAASAVYKAAKEAEAYRWYERLKAGEFIVDERVIERMRAWTLEGQIEKEKA